jgi:hypothetical protein
MTKGASRKFAPAAEDPFPTQFFRKAHLLVSLLITLYTVHVLTICNDEFHHTDGPLRLLCSTLSVPEIRHFLCLTKLTREYRWITNDPSIYWLFISE